MKLAVRFIVAGLVVGACLSACAGSVVPDAPQPSQRDALLVLPGFGYSRDAQKVFRASLQSLADEGFDMYVPSYIERGGLDESQEELREFLRDHHLDRYERLHVFAFIAGAWTLNPILVQERLPNLVTVIYDRSPMQERAPRIAADKLHFLTWLRYGHPVFDMAKTPYAPVTPPGVRIGILVETQPTGLIKRYAAAARSYGPFDFRCDAFGQRHDDCIYVSMNHDDLYVRFADLHAEVLSFIRAGRFTSGADRMPPTDDPLPPRP